MFVNHLFMLLLQRRNSEVPFYHFNQTKVEIKLFKRKMIKSVLIFSLDQLNKAYPVRGMMLQWVW